MRPEGSITGSIQNAPAATDMPGGEEPVALITMGL